MLLLSMILARPNFSLGIKPSDWQFSVTYDRWLTLKVLHLSQEIGLNKNRTDSVLNIITSKPSCLFSFFIIFQIGHRL